MKRLGLVCALALAGPANIHAVICPAGEGACPLSTSSSATKHVGTKTPPASLGSKASKAAKHLGSVHTHKHVVEVRKKEGHVVTGLDHHLDNARQTTESYHVRRSHAPVTVTKVTDGATGTAVSPQVRSNTQQTQRVVINPGGHHTSNHGATQGHAWWKHPQTVQQPQGQHSITGTHGPSVIGTAQAPVAKPHLQPTPTPIKAPHATPVAKPYQVPDKVVTGHYGKSIAGTAQAPIPTPHLQPTAEPGKIPQATPMARPIQVPHRVVTGKQGPGFTGYALAPIVAPHLQPMAVPGQVPIAIPGAQPVKVPDQVITGQYGPGPSGHAEVPTPTPHQQPMAVPGKTPNATPGAQPVLVPNQIVTGQYGPGPSGYASVPTPTPHLQPMAIPGQAPIAKPFAQPGQTPPLVHADHGRQTHTTGPRTGVTATQYQYPQTAIDCLMENDRRVETYTIDTARIHCQSETEHIIDNRFHLVVEGFREPF